MRNATYWAVRLNDEQSAKLKAIFNPAHKNIYAEHSTIVFKPNSNQEKKLETRLGEKVELQIIGYAKDNYGEAVVISGIEREDGGIPHITISCDNGIKPNYSNTLLQNGFSKTTPITIYGTISKYTKYGWVKC